MVIFTRTFDFLSWLLPATKNFPRVYRHTFTSRLLGAAFELYEHLAEAQQKRGKERDMALKAAASELDKVRIYLRLAERWHWFSEGQYQHVASMVGEIGKLLVGWQRATS
ncbi:MAG: four helix bundle protein [Rhodothermales bacterium]